MPGIVTVVSPAASARLTTVAAARSEVGLTSVANDADLGLLIDRASAVIQNWCGAPFGVQTLSEFYRFAWDSGMGPAAQVVAPYGTPLNSQRKPLILSRRAAIVLVSVAETAALATTDYEADLPAGMIYRLRNGYRAWWNAQVATVVYTTGYVLPNDTGTRTLPFDVEDVCLALVRSAWFARGRDPNVALETLNGDRTSHWERSIGGSVIDDGLATQLRDYVVQAW